MFAENPLRIISRTQGILKVGGCDMRYGVALLLGAVLVIGCLSADAGAESLSSWADEPMKVVNQVAESMPSPSELSCAGSNSRVQMVNEETFRPACVYGVGSKPRVARLVNYAGQYEYAISFAKERYFYPLGYLCRGLDRCVYSQAEDTLLHQALLMDGSYTYRLVKHFSKQVQRIDGEQVSYQVQGLEGDLLLDGATMTTLGVSTNGRWAAIEVPRKGIVRLDIRTGQITWIASLVVSGASPQPVLGLAVSQDGSWVASTGWRQGLTVYKVQEPCGQTGAFHDVTQWCASSSVVKAELFPGYVRAYRPVFSGDGMRLSLFLVKQQGAARVTVAPASALGVQGAQYIALGDSYTSGEGELADSFYLPETNIATNHCHVSNRSYPLLLGNFWSLPAANAACSGSRISEVRLKLLQLHGTQPTLISLGIGGNDIDLIGKLKSCLGPGTCEWAKEGLRLSTAQEMKKILPDLVQLIDEAKLTTGAAVFVVGYPSVINTEASSCDALTASLLSHDEREYIEQSLQYLNTILRSAARYSEVTYVDTSQAFAGERLCEGAQKGMNAVRIGDDIAPLEFLKSVKFIGAESFHPTPYGHEKIAEAIRESYGAFWQAQECGSCSGAIDSVSYWTQGTSGLALALTQSAVHFLMSDEFTAGSSYSFSFEADAFEPATPVRVELRSDTHVLGEFVAAGDGSLSGIVALPSGVEGTHTVHVIGTSRSGEAIDMYQTIHIEPDANELFLEAGGMNKGDVPKSTGENKDTVAKIATTVFHDEVLGAFIASAAEPHQLETPMRHAPIRGNAFGFILLGLLVLLLGLIFLLLYRRKV